MLCLQNRTIARQHSSGSKTKLRLPLAVLMYYCSATQNVNLRRGLRWQKNVVRGATVPIPYNSFKFPKVALLLFNIIFILNLMFMLIINIIFNTSVVHEEQYDQRFTRIIIIHKLIIFVHRVWPWSTINLQVYKLSLTQNRN